MREVTLDNWVVHASQQAVEYGGPVVALYLKGDVKGHPKLEDGPITTSLVKRWIGNTVQTKNTRYTLKNFAGDGGATCIVLLQATGAERTWYERDVERVKENVHVD
jgi:hypothetical protein